MNPLFGIVELQPIFTQLINNEPYEFKLIQKFDRKQFETLRKLIESGSDSQPD